MRVTVSIPPLANAAGVQLDQLLWVRCQNVDQSLRATDLLIQSGGFGMVAVDLSDVSARLARQVPLHVWFRFRRAVEDTSTILLVMEQESQREDMCVAGAATGSRADAMVANRRVAMLRNSGTAACTFMARIRNQNGGCALANSSR